MNGRGEKESRWPETWRQKGGKEDRECDGRTAIREIWKEWEENGEQKQKDRRSWRQLIA